MLKRMIIASLVLVLVSLVTADMPRTEMAQLETYARIPCIMGQPQDGYAELYEFDMWLSEAGHSEAHVRRCGAPPYRAITHDGYSPFEVVPGRYAILLHQPEWFLRPAVVPNVTVRPGKSMLNVIPSLDYSCVTRGGKLGPWEKSGSPDPWISGKTFYQTFVARGTSITHVHFRLAGTKAEIARVSIHKVDEGLSPDRWKRVGPERIADKLGALKDNWVGWRSGEVVTIPGQRYAVRIAGEADGLPEDMAMLVHYDNVGPGYEKGTAWVDGIKQQCDIYGSISSDSDGTVIPYMRIYEIKPGELGGTGTWSQTWVAQGKSIAAVDLLVAWGMSEDVKGVQAEFRIREGGPNGKIIGVPKRTFTAWWAPGMGFLGAAWQPGEVSLTPGKTYCVECVAISPSKGYNVAVINSPNNAYPRGMAFRDGVPVANQDLEMTIVEYKTCPKPVTNNPVHEPKGKNFIVNGGFEGGIPNEQNAQDPSGWTRWNTRQTSFWYGKYGRNGSNAARIIGGNINDTCIDGGYVQRVTGLDSKKTYCLSGWTSSSAKTDMCYMTAVGYDPTGQTSDPNSPTIVWKLAGRRSFIFDRVVFMGIRPQTDSISIWTRGSNNQVGDLVFTVDFDDFALVEESNPGGK